MPAPNQSPLDGNPNASPPATEGYRPGLDDANGAALADDPIYPPDPQTMPTSALLNYFGAFLVSIGRAIAVAGFGLNAGANPTFQFWWTGSNDITAAGVNPFTVTRVAAGHYQITWTSGLFPLVGWPKPYLNAAGSAANLGITAEYMTSPPAGTQGVEVWTVQGGALTDLNCQVDLF